MQTILRLLFFLSLTALAGDYLQTVPLVTRSLFVRAILDSSTHAAIGLISWTIVCYNTSLATTFRQNAGELALATFLSSFIDKEENDKEVKPGDIWRMCQVHQVRPFHIGKPRVELTVTV